MPVHQVVHRRHVEDSENRRIAVKAGEGELIVVRGEARNKAEQADNQKHRGPLQQQLVGLAPNFEVNSDVRAG